MGGQDEDSSFCSTFGASTKTTNEDISASTNGQILPIVPQQACCPSQNTTTAPKAVDNKRNADAREQMVKFNKFHKFANSQKDFVHELCDLAGELKDELKSKLIAALDFYRIENFALMKKCMI